MKSALGVDHFLFHNNNLMEHISKAYILYTYIFYFLESMLGA